MVSLPREGPGERSQQSPFSSPSRGNTVLPRVQTRMEGAQANNTRCSPFPGHMHVPGMGVRTREDRDTAASLPTTQAIVPHQQRGQEGSWLAAEPLLTVCVVQNLHQGSCGAKDARGVPLKGKCHQREGPGRSFWKAIYSTLIKDPPPFVVPYLKQTITPPSHPLCRTEWWLTGLS